MSDGKRMTRRGFVGAALAGTMGVAASSFLAGCSAPTSSSDSQEWDQEADVVVVGAGGAGLAAAIEAANAGASVLLLEKASAVGGDSALSDGILGGWGTKLAKEQGIDADADGRVIGVEAVQKKNPVRIKANKGVVMATGSFAGSTAMIGQMNAECANLLPGSNPGATGDGLVMAMELGAYTTRVSDMPLMSSLAGLESGSIVNINYGMRLPGLWLDAEGQRFFDESTPYENPNGHRAIVRKQNEQGSPVIALLGTTPELDAMQATYPLKWATADTVEEVAGMVGLDGAKAKATVERYNGFCEAGKDEDCGTPADKMVPMTGPFYAAPIAVSTSVTVGGFKTNEQAQALRLALASSGSLTEPIPGLYAAGVVCEWNCAAGATVLSAMTLGRIAGRSAAAEASAA